MKPKIGRDLKAEDPQPEAHEGCRLGGPPRAAMVTIRDKKGYVRVLLYSSCTIITRWGSSQGVVVEGLGFKV